MSKNESKLSKFKKRWKERYKRLTLSIQRREALIEELSERLEQVQKKDDIELARAERAKIIRSLTRLKYSLMADREINQTLSESMLDFDSALQNGELKQLNIGDILDATRAKSN